MSDIEYIDKTRARLHELLLFLQRPENASILDKKKWYEETINSCLSLETSLDEIAAKRVKPVTRNQ